MEQPSPTGDAAIDQADQSISNGSPDDKTAASNTTNNRHRQKPSIYLPLASEAADPTQSWIFANKSQDEDTFRPPPSPSLINKAFKEPATPSASVVYAQQQNQSQPFAGPTYKRVNVHSPYKRELTAPPSGFALRFSPTTLRLLDSPTSWLAYYFFANLALTLYNKLVLVKFPFPWTVTGIHTLASAIGSWIFLQNGLFTQAVVSRRDSLILLSFSVLYTINIAVSNVSLHLVTVPVHQVVRASTPLFTIFISVFFLRKRYTKRTIISLLPVVAGVGFATYGDYYFSAYGLFLTLLGTFLAAVKGIATYMLQAESIKLHPLDLLMRMSPLAFTQCVFFAWWTGELAKVQEYSAQSMTRNGAMALAINGLIAFFLNVVSFSANKKTSALTMTVAANVKQVLTVVLAVWIFDLVITPLNALGIILTLIGGGIYGRSEYQQKQASSRTLIQPLTEVKSLSEKEAVKM